jgi:two-component system sensor histidine kinase KdpD
LLSIAAFDFFFVPPYLSFAVSDIEYLLTLAVMLLVALMIGGLTVRIRDHAELARHREERMAVLYAMSRELASHRGTETLAQVAAKHLREVFKSQVAVFLPGPDGRLILQRGPQFFFELDPKEQGVTQWVFEHNQRAGLGTDTLPGAKSLYVPLTGSKGPLGVVAIRPPQAGRPLDLEQLHLLEALVISMALAIERACVAEEAQVAHLQTETERMRNAILSSVSHDLRTPLATIMGGASSLAQKDGVRDERARKDLARGIYEEAQRLDRLLRNLLDITKLESGAVQLHKEWLPLEEVVGAALTRLERSLHDRSVRTVLPPGLPLVHVDGILLEQVFMNLLENALKYAPPSTPIDIGASIEDHTLIVEVADRGPGLSAGEDTRIFEKFYRGMHTHGGAGLGLTICRGIIEAHGGRIWAEPRDGGGARFRFTLPLDEAAPMVVPESDTV